MNRAARFKFVHLAVVVVEEEDEFTFATVPHVGTFSNNMQPVSLMLVFGYCFGTEAYLHTRSSTLVLVADMLIFSE